MRAVLFNEFGGPFQLFFHIVFLADDTRQLFFEAAVGGDHFIPLLFQVADGVLLARFVQVVMAATQHMVDPALDQVDEALATAALLVAGFIGAAAEFRHRTLWQL